MERPAPTVGVFCLTAMRLPATVRPLLHIPTGVEQAMCNCGFIVGDEVTFEEDGQPPDVARWMTSSNAKWRIIEAGKYTDDLHWVRLAGLERRVFGCRRFRRKDAITRLLEVASG